MLLFNIYKHQLTWLQQSHGHPETCCDSVANNLIYSMLDALETEEWAGHSDL